MVKFVSGGVVVPSTGPNYTFDDPYAEKGQDGLLFLITFDDWGFMATKLSEFPAIFITFSVISGQAKISGQDYILRGNKVDNNQVFILVIL